MFKKRKERKERERAVAEKISNDRYLTRLKNSAYGFSGSRHSGSGPFLSIGEIKSLIRRELDRKSREI
jgi:hypothetical protein